MRIQGKEKRARERGRGRGRTISFPFGFFKNPSTRRDFRLAEIHWLARRQFTETRGGGGGEGVAFEKLIRRTDD